MISEVYLPNIWRQGQSGVGTSEYSALTTLQQYPVQLTHKREHFRTILKTTLLQVKWVPRMWIDVKIDM